MVGYHDRVPCSKGICNEKPLKGTMHQLSTLGSELLKMNTIYLDKNTNY